MRGISSQGFFRLSRFVAQLDRELSIDWVPPDLAEEVDEYVWNPSTQKFLASHGIELESEDAVVEFLSTGSMAPVTSSQLSQAENVTLGGEEFESELEEPEYRSSFSSMEDALLSQGSVQLPAPILLKIGGAYWGFSGNRRTNLALKYDLPLEAWLVEVP